jgi:hypothetical protein
MDTPRPAATLRRSSRPSRIFRRALRWRESHVIAQLSSWPNRGERTGRVGDFRYRIPGNKVAPSASYSSTNAFSRAQLSSKSSAGRRGSPSPRLPSLPPFPHQLPRRDKFLHGARPRQLVTVHPARFMRLAIRIRHVVRAQHRQSALWRSANSARSSGRSNSDGSGRLPNSPILPEARERT